MTRVALYDSRSPSNMRPVSYFDAPDFLTIAFSFLAAWLRMDGLMKRIGTTALIGLMGLAGCAVNPSTPAERASMRRAFDARIVSCALPYLYGPSDRVVVDYRYTNGKVIFRSKTDSDALRDHIVQCATPEDGPRGAFSGRVEIWGKR
jgi:hypothetical protein